MKTRIDNSGPQNNVSVRATAYRTTPTPSRPFNSLVQNGKDAVVSGAEAAASRLPGGPEVVAAVRGEGGGAFTLQGVGGPGANPSSAYSGTATGAPASSASPAEGSLENALSKQTEDSLYYLGLQQRIQEETRNYQAVSNVLKARHESAKNAIGNLR
jgi:hypothetical protein